MNLDIRRRRVTYETMEYTLLADSQTLEMVIGRAIRLDDQEIVNDLKQIQTLLKETAFKAGKRGRAIRVRIRATPTGSNDV